MEDEHKGEKIEIDLKKRREALKEIMEAREEEVEYGYFKGCLSDVPSLLTNPHADENPLQSPLRLCKLWGAFRFALSTIGAIALVHGPIGCTYTIGKGMTAVSATGNWSAPLWPCFCTDMGEEEIIFGGEEKLRRAILAVDRDYKPDLIAVLTACPVSIIGDDVKAVVDSVRDKIKPKIIWVDSAGFSYRNQGAGYDEYLLAVVDQLMEEPKQKIPNSINWVGEWGFPLEPPQMSDMQEMGRVLNKIGITIHCSLPGGETVSKLITAPEAEVNAMRCTGNALRAVRRMEEKFGMPSVTTGIPQGIQPTVDFIMAVAEKLDLVKKAEEVVDEEVKQTLEAIEPYKKVLKGKKIAISASTARVTAVGKFAVELGMEPVFLDSIL
jgi:Nitrogenase molybdenum-iron protein, alpha and beta chains